MPIYVMKCDTCGHEEDIYRSIANIDHDLPECHGKTMYRKVCAPAVIADIQPYQAVAVDKATGKMPQITSRSQHREFLQRNGYVEVGNEMPKPKKQEIQGDFNVRQELAEVTRQVLPKYKN